MIFLLGVGRSFLSRAESGEDPAAAVADLRTVVRLGRLALQERFTVIQELVGLALVRLGAEGLFEEARTRGDAEAMLVASLVLADTDGQRLRWTQALASVPQPADAMVERWDGSRVIELEKGEADRLFRLARRATARPLRLEGLMGVGLLASLGRAEDRDAARAVLRELAGDADEAVAKVALWHLEHPYEQGDVLDLLHVGD